MTTFEEFRKTEGFQLLGDNGTITDEDTAKFTSLICRHNESLNTVAFAFLTSFKRRCSWSIAIALLKIYEDLYIDSSLAIKKRIVLIYLIFRVAELDGTDVCGAGIEHLGHMFLPFLLKVANGDHFAEGKVPEDAEKWMVKLLLSSKAEIIATLSVDNILEKEHGHENMDCDRIRRFYSVQMARFPSFEESGERKDEEELDKIVEKLLSGKVLNMAQNRQLLDAISTSSPHSPLLTKFEELSLPEMSKVIEDHRRLASEVIYKLVKKDDTKAIYYMEIMMNMDMSVQCIEAVMKLYNEPGLPREPLRAFVSHCLKACEEAAATPAKQSRHVRLVCLFVSSLLKKEILPVTELDAELSSFVMRFSQYKETTNLFQSLTEARSRLNIPS